MKLLELFSGTCSVGTVAKDRGWTVVSLDLKGADINCDILQWKYKKYPVKYFDFVWASPPCIEYSIAKTVGTRKIDEANAIVLKMLEIINYFNPRVFIIENPQSGLLKKQEFMKGLPYFDIDYCKYGFNYRKRTRLWTNLDTWTPRPLCKKIAIVWMETVIKKLPRGHPVVKKRTGKKAIPCSNKRICIEYLKHWLKKL
jgi:hypothetical protein